MQHHLPPSSVKADAFKVIYLAHLWAKKAHKKNKPFQNNALTESTSTI